AYVPDVYADEIHLRLLGSETLETTLVLDDSADVYFEVAPENTNRFDVTWVSTDPSVAVLDYKSNPTSHHKYVTGVGVGTAEIYCVYEGENGAKLESEHLKVTVKGIKDQNKEGAVYDFVWSGHEDVRDEQGKFDHTNLFATNLIPGTAPFAITSHNVRTLEAKNTDSFGKDGYVLYATPSNSEFMNNGFYSEAVFDFGDQQVSDLSFHYALHRSSQRNDALSALGTAYIATSNDGETWSDPISIKEEMLAEFEKINVDYPSNQKLLERSFAPASKVKIYFKASVVGKNIGLCLDDFVFLANEECHDHEDVVSVPVSSVSLSAPDTRLKVGESMMLSAAILPADASDKSLTYRVSDPTLASVSPAGLLTALGEGSVEVVAIASNGVESNPVTIELYAQEELPESALGTYLAGEVYASGSWYDVKLEVASLTSATLTLTPDSGEPLVIPFSYDHYDDESVAPHVFLSDTMTLKVRFGADGADVFLRGGTIDLGNTYTNEGEALTRYVASASIVARQSGTPIDSLALKVGKSASFTASVLPAKAYYQDVTASAQDATIAKVEKAEGSNYFTVTGLSAGSTNVILRNADGLTMSLPVTVSEPVTLSSLSLSSSKSAIDIGGSATITPVLNPSSVDSVSLSYSSSDATVASVKKNQDGTATVSALKAGTVTITCLDSVSGLSATIDLVVNAASAAVPSWLVGTFEGVDDMSNTLHLSVDESGNGTLSCPDGNFETSFTLSSSDGDTYTFACDSGYDLVVTTNGSCLFVTYADGEFVEAGETFLNVADTSFYRM
ncbi:MAG: Ig-like domain-containing protein, partial [Candidatus Enteromonas sp.]